jgi:hypothetical protein
MSAAIRPQIVDSNDFIDVCDYEFSGDMATVDRKRRFIDAYRSEGSVFHAAHAIGIHRATVYKWMQADQAFVAAVEDSHEDSVDMVETSVFKKAIAGDTLSSIFYLKAHRAKYRDRVTIDVNQVESELTSRFTRQLTAQTLPSDAIAKKHNGD